MSRVLISVRIQGHNSCNFGSRFLKSTRLSAGYTGIQAWRRVSNASSRGDMSRVLQGRGITGTSV